MENIRPFQIVIMGIFAVIAIVGLFLFANFQGFGGGASQVGTVVVWGTLPEDAMTQALNAYKEQDEQFGRVSYVERPAATFDADLAEAIASGAGPDLIIITQEDLLAAESKISLIPSSSVSERTFRDSYLPVSELFLAPGGTYGIPFLVDPLVLYYNRPILASAGAATPPSTWEAVTGLAAAVNRQSDAQVITRSLIALGTYENVENARGILSLLFLQAGYRVSERTQAGFRATLMDISDQSFGTTPAESALNFYTEFANPTKTVYSWNRSLPGSRDAFLAGDVALYLGFASERQSLAEANPNLDFDMASAPVPATATARIAYARAYAFAIPKSSMNPEGAFEVATGLSGERALPLFADATGMAPARKTLLAPSSGDLYEPVYFPEALVARGWLSPAPNETDRIFATMVGNVISGRESVREALSSANQALTAAF